MKAQKQQKHNVWQNRIGEWRDSGKTQGRYCREKGLSLATFGYWKRRLAEPVQRQRFVRLATPEPQSLSRQRLTLILSSDLRIIFSERTPLSSVTRILETLCGSTGTR
jgi:hypothetical protein